MMKKYRKKPIVIEAYKWDSLEYDNIVKHCCDDEIPIHRLPNLSDLCQHCKQTINNHGFINTLEGTHIVCDGDWIIKGIKGEYYPCKPDILDATYEEI